MGPSCPFVCSHACSLQPSNRSGQNLKMWFFRTCNPQFNLPQNTPHRQLTSTTDQPFQCPRDPLLSPPSYFLTYRPSFLRVRAHKRMMHFNYDTPDARIYLLYFMQMAERILPGTNIMCLMCVKFAQNTSFFLLKILINYRAPKCPMVAYFKNWSGNSGGGNACCLAFDFWREQPLWEMFHCFNLIRWVADSSGWLKHKKVSLSGSDGR